MAAGGIEVKFASRLGSNEATVRNKAVKGLRRWISARSSSAQRLSELELLKLWKGLYVCMWHSDRPLVQEELAEGIASLVRNFTPTDTGLEYIKTFFITVAREWHGIDRLRIDKFYLLIRRVVSYSFKVLKEGSWEEKLVHNLGRMYQEGPLNPSLENLHVSEVYLTELGQLMDDDLPASSLLILLGPLFRLYSCTKNSIIADSVEKDVLSVLLSERGRITFKIDADTLKQILVQWAANRDTTGKARKYLYALKNSLEDQDCGGNVWSFEVKRRKLTF